MGQFQFAVCAFAGSLTLAAGGSWILNRTRNMKRSHNRQQETLPHLPHPPRCYLPPATADLPPDCRCLYRVQRKTTIAIHTSAICILILVVSWIDKLCGFGPPSISNPSSYRKMRRNSNRKMGRILLAMLLESHLFIHTHAPSHVDFHYFQSQDALVHCYWVSVVKTMSAGTSVWRSADSCWNIQMMLVCVIAIVGIFLSSFCFSFVKITSPDKYVYRCADVRWNALTILVYVLTLVVPLIFLLLFHT